MTYLFKLAQRMAKIRFGVLVGVLGAVGCSKGEKTEFLAPNQNQNTPVLNSIRLEPQVTSVRVGSELQFIATGYSAAGAVMPATVDWSAAGGIITPDGRYTGVLTGSFMVRATARERAGVTDSARVVVFDNTADLVALVVSPDSAVIEVGDTLDFTAALQMASGAMTGSLNVIWSSTGGQISPAGRFTSSVAGQFEVTAISANSLRGTARVAVQQHQRTLLAIRLNPSAATVLPGGSAQFAATAEYDDGTTGTGDVEWRATGGTISSGLYVVTNGSGTYQVIATDRGGLRADTAMVTVPSLTLARLVISPSAPVLAPGAIQPFTAQAQMSDGSWWVLPLLWTASAGVIGPDGVYTAGAAQGVFRVIVTSPGSSVADTAEVSVVASTAELVGVILNPSSATVPAGATRQFSVAGVWSNGGNSTPSVTWSATGGTITLGGLFAAGPVAGSYAVIATAQNGRADTSAIQVTSPALTSLQLAPSNSSMQPGQSLQFSLSGTWSNGSTAAPVATYSAAGGTITAGGLYVAGPTAGTYAVIATQQGGVLADTSLVTISTPPPTITGVVLTPTSAVLAPGGIQQFAAGGLYSNGTIGTISITWSATGGSINTSGGYTAGSTPGAYRVIARQTGNTRADSSVVTITSPPAVTSLAVSPKPASLQVNSSAQFGVSATWSDGSTTVPPIVWAASGGSITSTGWYTAGAVAGTFRVVAAHQGGTRADTSVVTLTASPPPTPTLTALVVSPKPTSVQAGATRQFTVGALWSDGSGTVPAITWTATGGTISSAGLYTAGVTPGAFRAIASGGGKADTAAVTITAPPPPPQSGCTAYPGSIWCDDFEQNRLSSYFEYDNDGGDFAPVSGVGVGGSTGMRVRWEPGEVGAGNLKLAFGRTPDAYIRPVDAGTADYRDIYWRLYIKNQAGWTGGGADKLSRALVFATSNWAEAMIGHTWSAGTGSNYLVIDPASGTDAAGTLKTTVYNDFPNLRWLGGGQSQTPIFDAAHVGQWYCVETHVLLNTAGQSNGLFELWINDALEVHRSSLNWVGNYSAYGINTIMFENYWNAGSPVAQERYFDNIVVGTQRIGCGGATTPQPPTLSALILNPSSASLQTSGTLQFSASALWSDGSTTLPAVTWSATGGTVGSTGLYTAGSSAGTYRVIVSGGGRADTSTVTLTAATVTQFTLTPATVTVPTGGTQQFQTGTTWSDGVIRAVSVTYSATGGSISVGGLFTAGAVAGTFSVIASCGCGKADTSVVSVSVAVAATLSSLVITPAAVALAPGGSRQFAASATWSDGSNTVPPTAYTASGGSVTTGGFYTAPMSAGTYQVVLSTSASNLRDTSVVTVTAPVPPPPPPPPPPTGPGNPVPSGTIFLDTRVAGANSLQAPNVTTLAQAAAAWAVGTPSPYLSGNIGFTTNLDGAGTHAFSASLVGWGGTSYDGGAQMAWYLPNGPKPTRLYVQWKHRMGRTATGGGIGAEGFFDITNQNDPGGNAGRKYLLMLRDVADGGSGGRVDHVWAGPSPVSVHTEGWYGLNPYPGNLGLNRCAFNPEAHINETIVFTHYLQAESSPGASDGAVRVWYNGVLCAEHTGIPSGSAGIHRFQFPATFRSPIADQTEYFWDIVVWSP